jgi:phosphoglycolate phosphatase
MKRFLDSLFTVIWDIDGTLLNTRGGIVAAYKHTLDMHNIGYTDNEDELAKLIGPTPQEIFKSRFGISPENAQIYASEFREYYRTNELDNAYPYAGIESVLSNLQSCGIPQFVVTNKRQDYAEEILEIFRLKGFFRKVYGTDTNSSRSKSQLLDFCINEHDIEPDAACFIGDTAGDKDAANKNGVRFIGVNYGFGFRDVADYAGTPADLVRILGF